MLLALQFTPESRPFMVRDYKAADCNRPMMRLNGTKRRSRGIDFPHRRPGERSVDSAHVRGPGPAARSRPVSSGWTRTLRLLRSLSPQLYLERELTHIWRELSSPDIGL